MDGMRRKAKVYGEGFRLKKSVIRGREALKRVVGFSFLIGPNQALSAAHCRNCFPRYLRRKDEESRAPPISTCEKA